MKLGDRIKEYEAITNIKLIRKLPVIMRLDGRKFSTFCRGLQKPWDQRLNDVMAETAIALCQEIQGAQCAYIQSDEITILITDLENINTEAWFGYRIQKMTSVGASIATDAFLKQIGEKIPEKYKSAIAFDCRVFNVPSIQEVLNVFLWRQQDAVRNSKLSLGQSLFSHSQLQGVSSRDVATMAHGQHGINWANHLTPSQKWGTMVVKRYFDYQTPNGDFYTRSEWVGDEDTPGLEDIKAYVYANSNLEKLCVRESENF